MILASSLCLDQKEPKKTQKFVDFGESSDDLKSETPLQIGYGLDTRTMMPRSVNCFSNSDEPHRVQLKNFSQQLNFDKSLSITELTSITTVEMTFKVGWGWFSFSTTARYIKEAKDTKYSMNFNFAQTFSADAIYHLPSAYGKSILSASAQNVLSQGSRQFIKLCGDSYVSNAKMGATLLVTVGISFHTYSDKSRFEASVREKISSITSVTQAYKSAVAELKMNAGLYIKALQLGGDTSSLAKIFGQPDTKGNYAAANCTPTNLDACSNIINSIIKYSQEEFTTSINPEKPDTLYTFGYHTESFESLGIYIETFPLPKAVIDAQKLVKELFIEKTEALLFLNAYSALPSFKFWDEKDLAYFNSVKIEHELALRLFEQEKISIACFDKNMEEECLPALQSLQDKFNTFDNLLVAKLRNIFIGEAYEDLQITLIPAKNDIVFNPDTNEVYGTFFAMYFKHSLINISGLCKVDMSPTPVFKEINQEFHVECNNKDHSFPAFGTNLWVKRVYPTAKEGVTGAIGWDGYTKPIPPSGYNTIFVRRTDWESIPI